MPDEGVTLWKPRGAIEARRLTEDNAVAIAGWVSGSGVRCDQFAEPARLVIHQAGVRNMNAGLGDWIVRGTHQWLTCNAPRFRETYEPLVNSADVLPPYISDLIDAWALGRPLDFHGHEVPLEVQERIAAEADQDNVPGIPFAALPARSPDPAGDQVSVSREDLRLAVERLPVDGAGMCAVRDRLSAAAEVTG